jgi:hypothetical protein
VKRKTQKGPIINEHRTGSWDVEHFVPKSKLSRKRRKLKKKSVQSKEKNAATPAVEDTVKDLTKWFLIGLLYSRVVKGVSLRDAVAADSQERVDPPKYAELFLSLLFNKGEREAAIGDFREMYGHKYATLGRKQANKYALKQILQSSWPVLVRLVSRMVLFVVGEWIKKRIS